MNLGRPRMRTGYFMLVDHARNPVEGQPRQWVTFFALPPRRHQEPENMSGRNSVRFVFLDRQIAWTLEQPSWWRRVWEFVAPAENRWRRVAGIALMDQFDDLLAYTPAILTFKPGEELVLDLPQGSKDEIRRFAALRS